MISLGGNILIGEYVRVVINKHDIRTGVAELLLDFACLSGRPLFVVVFIFGFVFIFWVEFIFFGLMLDF